MALALPEDGVVIACDISEEYTNIGKPFWKEVHVTSVFLLPLKTPTLIFNCTVYIFPKQHLSCSLSHYCVFLSTGWSWEKNWSTHSAGTENFRYGNAALYLLLIWEVDEPHDRVYVLVTRIIPCQLTECFQPHFPEKNSGVKMHLFYFVMKSGTFSRVVWAALSISRERLKLCHSKSQNSVINRPKPKTHVCHPWFNLLTIQPPYFIYTQIHNNHLVVALIVCARRWDGWVSHLRL